MRIGLQTWGTEGDIRPFVALAFGLSASGHDVTLAATDIMNREYSQYGAEGGFSVIHPGHIEVSEQEFKELGRRMVASFSPVSKSRLLIDNFLNPVIPAMYETSKELCNTCDLVIGHLFAYPLKAAAENAGVPWISLYTSPLLPSDRVSPPGFPVKGSLLWWKAFDGALNLLWKPDMDDFFTEAGLEKPRSILNDVFRSDQLNLVTVSPSIYPVESASTVYRFCGDFQIPAAPEQSAVSDSLDEFLSQGEKPVYFTFGSMFFGEQHTDKLISMVLEAVGATGDRAVIQIPENLHGSVMKDSSVYLLSRAEHSRIFSRCKAVVHHGGCGTCHSVCRAGVPSVVVPYTADQPMWGRIMHEAGVSPAMIPRRSLTVKKLISGLTEVMQSGHYSNRAQIVSREMAQEDGVSTAIQAIQERFR